MRRSLAVTALAVAVVGLGSSPAYAHGGGDPRGEGEFVPADPADYPPVEFEACGSVITLSNGDVFEVEERVTELPNGGSLIEFRGDWTVDLVRKSDGATIDELDIGGPGYELARPKGDEVHIVNKLYANSVLFRFGVPPHPADVAAFDEAGIPDLAYFTEGNVELEIVVDAETGEPKSVEFDEVDANIVDLCPLFDEDEDDDHEKDDDHDKSHGKKGHGKHDS
jgi:hypothetical protein